MTVALPPSARCDTYFLELRYQGQDDAPADVRLVTRLDGLLVRYPTWWFNIRASNTEPVLRLNLEADTLEEMERRRDEILGRIEALGAGR